MPGRARGAVIVPLCFPTGLSAGFGPARGRGSLGDGALRLPVELVVSAEDEVASPRLG